MKKLKVDGLGIKTWISCPSLSLSFILPRSAQHAEPLLPPKDGPSSGDLERHKERERVKEKERDRKEREKRKWRVWLGSGLPTGCSHVISAPVLLGSAICLVALLCLALGQPGSAPIHQPHWEQLWSYGAPHYSLPLHTNLNTTNTVWWLAWLWFSMALL